MVVNLRSKMALSLFLMAFFFIFISFGCENEDPGCGNNGGGTSTDIPSSDPGPYQTAQDLSSGPEGESGVWYPTNAEAGETFPIFLWGCGGGSQPRAYVDHMSQIASYGFVVIAEVSTGTGNELTSALEWIISQNSNSRSPLYQIVDSSMVAAGGHSMGSISTFAIADDPRLTTTIHVAGGSLDGRGSRARDLVNPTAFICGANDELGATDNAEVDFEVVEVPTFFGVMEGVGHIDAARQGLPAIISWLRWYLKGETDLSSEFLEAGGAFQTGMWNSQIKNW